MSEDGTFSQKKWKLHWNLLRMRWYFDPDTCHVKTIVSRRKTNQEFLRGGGKCVRRHAAHSTSDWPSGAARTPSRPRRQFGTCHLGLLAGRRRRPPPTILRKLTRAAAYNRRIDRGTPSAPPRRGGANRPRTGIRCPTGTSLNECGHVHVTVGRVIGLPPSSQEERVKGSRRISSPGWEWQRRALENTPLRESIVSAVVLKTMVGYFPVVK